MSFTRKHLKKVDVTVNGRARRRTRIFSEVTENLYAPEGCNLAFSI